MAKCPPGVICFENFTFTFIILSLIVIIYFVYSNKSSYKIEMKQSTDTITHKITIDIRCGFKKALYR